MAAHMVPSTPFLAHEPRPRSIQATTRATPTEARRTDQSMAIGGAGREPHTFWLVPFLLFLLVSSGPERNCSCRPTAEDRGVHDRDRAAYYTRVLLYEERTGNPEPEN